MTGKRFGLILHEPATPLVNGEGEGEMVMGKRLSGRRLVCAVLYSLACLGNVLARSRNGMASREERRDTQESEHDQAGTCHSSAHDIHLTEWFRRWPRKPAGGSGALGTAQSMNGTSSWKLLAWPLYSFFFGAANRAAVPFQN